MKDVKIVLARRFEAALEAIKKVDADRDAYLMADVRDLIPEPPKPLELRGPSWSAIARGVALPIPSNPLISESPVTPQPASPIASVAGEGPAPLEVGATVEYAGMKGVVAIIIGPPPYRYVVQFPNGATSHLSDRDLGRA